MGAMTPPAFRQVPGCALPRAQSHGDERASATRHTSLSSRLTCLQLLAPQDLYAAPDTIQGADYWKLHWSHEQRTFSDYFRDGFAEGEDLVIASCADANDAAVQCCNGTFVTHLWGRKDEVRATQV